MSLEVITPAENRLLTTLDTIKSQFLATIPQIADGAYDARLNRLLAWATDAIRKHLGRELARQQYHELLPGYGDTLSNLAVRPVETGSVILLVDGVTNTDFTLDSELGILMLEDGFRWSAQLWGGVQFSQIPGSETNNVDATYWAGYVLPGDDQSILRNGVSTALPGDIERACWITVHEWFNEDDRDENIVNRQSSTGSRRAEATDPFVEANVQYVLQQKPPENLPFKALALLRGYKDTV
jgi:hypothetical protein